MEDLSAASLEDVAEFFRTFYTPDNAVLTVAGDFDPALAREMIARHFVTIPRGQGRPALPPMSVPPAFGEWRREVLPDAVAAPRLFLAFRVPPAGSDASYAASLAGAILGIGDGSRLVRTLVRDQAIASSATAFTFDLTKGSDLLIVDVTARPGVTADALEAAVAAVIDALIAEGVQEEERERALALLETAWMAALQSAGTRADRLSQFATYHGSAARVNEEMQRHAAVTAGEVTAFARRSLVATNRASLLYVPREEEST
jgi:predicted Zn-dependent peptidase